MNEPRQDVYRLRALLRELERVVRPLPDSRQLDAAVTPTRLPPLPPTGRERS